MISTSELTPEAQKLADEGKFQPVSDRMAQEWTKDKNNEDNSNSSNPKTINGRPAGDAGNEVNMSAKNANVDSENTEDEDDSEN
ncbi:hypothetical protein ACO2FM_04050 [Staphylococcus pasteuri]